MDAKQLLNKYLYPSTNTNVRRKSYPYYDTQAIATGTTQYFFFVTPIGNQFLRNKTLPTAGSEVFFVEAISAYIELKISTLALANAMNELLQQSYLQISVDDRVICKIPGLDFINYLYSDAWSDQVVVTAVQPRYGGHLNSDGFLGRKLPIPIILNSTSAFEFKFVTTAAAATAFNGINMKLTLHGLQLDKLESFEWNDLKNNQFQKVPVTYYWTNALIAAGAAGTYQLFANPNAAQNLFSKTFPLSDIVSASIQNIEVFFNQPDTPIEPSTIWYSRLPNVLNINIDEVDFYNSNLTNLLSLFAGFGVALTTTPNLDVVNFTNIRQSYTLPVPLEIPANSNVLMSLQQPAASLGITGELTVALRGVETRRVA